ncbi:cellulase family glycosylhydrolase [Paractinoplanes ferrugineus]|uniref:cellulase family glycosylhydrolase n=1 Tax=Paractinoplanes ferrugineus TaxID=113564 RepID=UPI001EF2AA79|nr:cellulase family glycosylhydrolase [Actinoplanes ferrugineus]
MRRLRVLLCAVLAAVPLLTLPAEASAATSGFRGVNWADARDNYVDGWVIPTGLTASDSYSTVRTKADGVVTGFQNLLGANTLRLPINPQSVNSAWWTAYKGAFDSALAHGMKVIVSYWEADTSKNGLVDDTAGWNTMWDRVTSDFAGNPNVYFEPMNEPFGYSLSSWVSLCSGWLARHSNIPRGRVVISGTGYNDNVTGVGAATALTGTLLSLHFYGFWASDTTRAAWTANLTDRLGSYSARTIIDEAGAPMTTGLTYTNGATQDGNVFTSYFAATTDLTRARQMGVVYWPGLRSGDTYSITRQSGSGLAVNNASGVAQLRWGWGL